MENSEILQELKEIKNLTLLSVKPFLTTREVSMLLDVTPGTIRNLVSSGRLPYCKPFGKRTYFLREDIIRLAEQSYVPSVNQIITDYGK